MKREWKGDNDPVKNRRRYPRVTIKATAEIFCVDDNRRFEAFVGGISRGGLEIYARDPVKKGCRLQITMHFLDQNGKPSRETVSGEVRWTAPFEKAHISGIEFEQVLDAKRNPTLAAYLASAEAYFKSGS
jgi:c-di-GMP-binding flagellar brake protein YcgR